VTRPPDDDRLREAYARLLARADADPQAAPPDPEALHEALAGRTSPADRERLVEQAARSARGRRELALVQTAAGAAREAWPVGRPAAARWRPAALAAGVLLAATLGGVWWRGRTAPPDALRAPAAPPGVTLVREAVRAGEGATLAWRSVPGVRIYEVEVLAPDGALVHTGGTRDTTYLLPADVRPPTAAPLEWVVRARLSDGGVRASAPGRLTR
jgi:hypothetical protein